MDDPLDFMDAKPKKKKSKKPFFKVVPSKAPNNTAPSAMDFSQALEEFETLPPLSEATLVGQWVKSTNRPYRFFVNTGSTRMAFLWHNGTLSVRLEPDKEGWPDNYVARLKEFGMMMGSTILGSKYASIHLEVGKDPILARKALGSVVVGTMPLLNASANVQIAWGYLPVMIGMEPKPEPSFIGVNLPSGESKEMTILLTKQKKADEDSPF